LGIDIGTTATKTLAVSEDGSILAEASASYPLSHPKPLWSEQDPEDWWKATVKTVRQVMRQAKLKPAGVHRFYLRLGQKPSPQALALFLWPYRDVLDP
jgi:xylulokinase